MCYSNVDFYTGRVLSSVGGVGIVIFYEALFVLVFCKTSPSLDWFNKELWPRVGQERSIQANRNSGKGSDLNTQGEGVGCLQLDMGMEGTGAGAV